MTHGQDNAAARARHLAEVRERREAASAFDKSRRTAESIRLQQAEVDCRVLAAAVNAAIYSITAGDPWTSVPDELVVALKRWVNTADLGGLPSSGSGGTLGTTGGGASGTGGGLSNWGATTGTA